MSAENKTEKSFDLADPGAVFPTPEQAAAILRGRGLNISHFKLKSLRSTGDGPMYTRNPSGRPVYLHHVDSTRSPLVLWASSQLAPPATGVAEEWERSERAKGGRRRGH